MISHWDYNKSTNHNNIVTRALTLDLFCRNLNSFLSILGVDYVSQVIINSKFSINNFTKVITYVNTDICTGF